MQKLIVISGNPEATVTGTSSDTAQDLEDLGATISKTDVNGRARKAHRAEISVETNSIRITVGGATVTVDRGRKFDPGQTCILESEAEVESASILSQTAGSHADLQITTYFN